MVAALKKHAIEQDAALWKRIAVELERPARSKRVVNLSRLNRFTKDSDVIIVPGKVLGSGDIDHKLTVAAFSFSSGAVTKLREQKCDILSITELMQKNPKGQKVRIIG